MAAAPYSQSENVLIISAYVNTVHRDKFLIVSAVLSQAEGAHLHEEDMSHWWKRNPLPAVRLTEVKLRCNVKGLDGTTVNKQAIPGQPMESSLEKQVGGSVCRWGGGDRSRCLLL